MLAMTASLLAVPLRGTVITVLKDGIVFKPDGYNYHAWAGGSAFRGKIIFVKLDTSGLADNMVIVVDVSSPVGTIQYDSVGGVRTVQAYSASGYKEEKSR